MDNASFREIYALVQDWARRTDVAEQDEYNRLKIGQTGDLYPTIKTGVTDAGNGKIVAEHSFKNYGRFVDMGAGPGAKGRDGKVSIERSIINLENKTRNRERVRSRKDPKGRKPKKFYSVIFYGRLWPLLGTVAGKMTEQAVQITAEAITGTDQKPE